MGVNWIDFVLLVTIILIVGVEVKRGFGRALFDFIALIVAVNLIPILMAKTAYSFEFINDAATNKAFIYSVMFVIVGGICCLIGRCMHDSTLVSLELYDPYLGGVLGFGVAIILCHAFTTSLAMMGSVGSHLPIALTQSRLGMEFYDFKTYREVLTVLNRLSA